MSHLPRAIAIVAIGASFGCTTPDSSCGSESECAAGYVCENNACQKLCASSAECSANEVCSPGGICVPHAGVVDTRPRIDDVTGEDGTSQVRSQVRVIGDRLADAAFALVGVNEEPIILSAHVMSAGEVLLQLPADIVSGAYTLAAVNESGETNTPIELTLPELGPDEILGRLNTASGTVEMQRLPLEELDLRYYDKTSGALAVDEALSVGPGFGVVKRDEEHTDVTVVGNTSIQQGNLSVEGQTHLSGAVTSPYLWTKLASAVLDDDVSKKLWVSGVNHTSLRVVFSGSYDCNGSVNQRVKVRVNDMATGYWSTASSFNHGGYWGPFSDSSGIVTGLYTCYDSNPASISFELTFQKFSGARLLAYGSGTFMDPAHIRHWQLSGGVWPPSTDVTNFEISTQDAGRLTGRFEVWGVPKN